MTRTMRLLATALGVMALAAAPRVGAYQLGDFDAKQAPVANQLPFTLANDMFNAAPRNHAQGGVAYFDLDFADASLVGFGGSGEYTLAKSDRGWFALGVIGAAHYFTSDAVDAFDVDGGGKLSFEGGPGNQFAAATGLLLSHSRFDTDFGDDSDTSLSLFMSGRYTVFPDLATYLTFGFGSDEGALRSGYLAGAVYQLTNRFATGLELTDTVFDGGTIVPYLRYLFSDRILGGLGLYFGGDIDIGLEAEMTMTF